MYLCRRCHIEQPITLPPLEHSAASWIEQEAKRAGISVEEVARRLIYRGLEAETGSAVLTVYHDLDDLAGTWGDEEVAEFRKASADMDQVDLSLWQ
jgi:hypothetical protein